MQSGTAVDKVAGGPRLSDPKPQDSVPRTARMILCFHSNLLPLKFEQSDWNSVKKGKAKLKKQAGVE